MGTYLGTMPYTPPPTPKEWNLGQLNELVELARRKGIRTKRELAGWIGCDESLLSKYLKGTGATSDMARNAISYAEIRIKKLKDVPADKGSKN